MPPGPRAGWIPPARELDIAAVIEARLAKFNIGYVDEIAGAWAYRVRGTDVLRRLLEEGPSKRDRPSKPWSCYVRFQRHADAAAFAEDWARTYGVAAAVEGRTVRVSIRAGGPQPAQLAALATKHRGQIAL